MDPGHAPDFLPFPLSKHSVLSKVLESGKPILVQDVINDEAFKSLLSNLKNNLPELQNTLKVAIDEKDTELIYRSAHNLCNIANTFKFEYINELSHKIQSDAKEKK